MFFAKKGAGTLIKMMAEASTGDPNLNLVDSRIGIVSFSSIANTDVELTTERAPLRTAIASLSAGGGTNHKVAFEAAEKVLGPKGTNRQIAIMFTDGITTVGGDATHITDRMKAAGIEIYCIGLLDDPALLNRWASDPSTDHVSVTNDEKKLEDLFKKVASQSMIAGAQNITIRETVSSDFKITSVNPPSFGTAQLNGERNIIWTMDYAGVNLNPKTYSLTFEIKHIGNNGGIKAFNQSVSYQDQAGVQLTFPDPVIEVTCSDKPVYPEPCPKPTPFTISGCQDSQHIILSDTTLQSLGRIVQIDVTLKSICPGKRTAVAIFLMELNPDGIELPRGVKHVLVPAHTKNTCQDITLKCIRFILPEDLDASGTADSICNSRHFNVRVTANYIDTDFSCCLL